MQAADFPDWRDSAAYQFLRGAEPQAFAWEWLRRIPAYREAALARRAVRRGNQLSIVSEQRAAFAWGLHAFEDPRLAANAHPIWLAAKDPSVLQASAEICQEDSDSFLLAGLSNFIILGESEDGWRLLLSDGQNSLRIDVEGTLVFDIPVRFRCRICGFNSARRSIQTWERLRLLVMTGKLPRRAGFSEGWNRRQLLLIRTFDALLAGASQRQIAAELIRSDAADSGWRTATPSLRTQAQRLVKTARANAAGAFWNLLR